METKCDVLVIGAGLSGLTAARELRRKAPTLKVRAEIDHDVLLFGAVYKWRQPFEGGSGRLGMMSS